MKPNTTLLLTAVLFSAAAASDNEPAASPTSFKIVQNERKLMKGGTARKLQIYPPCNICGDGYMVGDRDAVTRFPTSKTRQTCGKFEADGQDGLMSPEECLRWQCQSYYVYKNPCKTSLNCPERCELANPDGFQGETPLFCTNNGNIKPCNCIPVSISFFVWKCVERWNCFETHFWPLWYSHHHPPPLLSSLTLCMVSTSLYNHRSSGRAGQGVWVGQESQSQARASEEKEA